MIYVLPSLLDPWLIRKDHKKNKDKKKRKSIDPDSIQSALLASGLGSKRPSFSSTPVISPAPNSAPGNHVDVCFVCEMYFQTKQIFKLCTDF